MNSILRYFKPIFDKSGRQYWERSETPTFSETADLHFSKSENPNSADKVYRAICATKKPEPQQIPTPPLHLNSFQKQIYNSVFKGFSFYETLLTEHGYITGDYGGPMFLLPGLIIVSEVTQSPFSVEEKTLMKMYMLNHQNEDGGWGLHIEDRSTMLGTGLQYVALRLLGMKATDPAMEKAKNWIHKQGGISSIPSWGKFYLSVLGIYSWKGCNSLFPEIWLFPEWLPFHPSRYWCHARMVYVPMAYAYGQKITGLETPTVKALKEELYPQGWDQVNWRVAQNACCEKDRYHQASFWLHFMNGITNLYEKIAPSLIRKKATDFILQYIHAEDEHTNYINIGPVNQAINSLCVWHALGAASPQFQKHRKRWKDYLWIAEDGMKMQGYNGAQLWETAFTVNALAESGISSYFKEAMTSMYRFIDISQIQHELPDKHRFYRHKRAGGWPFSTVDHGWPITDCTGDGLKATVILHQFFNDNKMEEPQVINNERLQKAVDLMLSFQSEDGGWASYEIRRGPFWLEHLNPSEVFGEIMVDYSYVECTSSTIQALRKFQTTNSIYKSNEIENQVERGIRYIKSKQRKDGSWYGSWGVCFTYAAWFALEALALENEFYSNSETVKKACDFLVSKQRADGSWGESHLSCVKKEYIQHEQGQVINTAWVLLSLMVAKFEGANVLEKGVRFLMSRQNENGDFPQEGISGVFNKNCMETYTSYRNVFPLWALGRMLYQNGI